MTKEEKAIMYFKDMRKKFCEDYLLGISKDSVAYKATMAEKEFYDTAIQALEQLSCDDCISRQAVLETQAKYAEHVGATRFWQMRDDFKALPSVKPQEPILSKIKTEIDRQEKWLLKAGYTAYNTDIAFDSIKNAIAESEGKE